MIDIENYNKNRGIYSPLVAHNGMVCGFWMTGQDYRNKSGYYGAYPPNYLKRIAMLFPESKILMHLFSGKTELGIFKSANEITVDCNPELEPKVLCDAENLTEKFDEKTFDLILADPPYNENHVKYGTKKVNKRKVIKECAKLLIKGGHLVWLDTSIPIWSKADGWKLVGTIGLVQSTNHACRVVAIFEKVI